MSKLNNAMHQMDKLEQLAKGNSWLNRIHPLVKLFVTILFVVTCVSFSKYQVSSLLSLAVFPFIIFVSGAVSFKECIYRLRVVLPVVFVMGIFNPLFDREVLFLFRGFPVTGGMLSFISLVVKGFLTVFASYILVASTPIEKVCSALRMIHFPKVLVTQILLVYRYISVLLQEAHTITQAYLLRSPSQKGIRFNAWGSFIGQLLLRTMDRAEEIYQSMTIRGFTGEFIYAGKNKFRLFDALYLFLASGLILLFRFVPVFSFLGGLFV